MKALSKLWWGVVIRERKISGTWKCLEPNNIQKMCVIFCLGQQLWWAKRTDICAVEEHTNFVREDRFGTRTFMASQVKLTLRLFPRFNRDLENTTTKFSFSVFYYCCTTSIVMSILQRHYDWRSNLKQQILAGAIGAFSFCLSNFSAAKNQRVLFVRPVRVVLRRRLGVPWPQWVLLLSLR